MVKDPPRRGKACALALFGALTAMAGQHAAAAEPAVCNTVPVAKVKLTDTLGFFSIQARIDFAPVSLLLDTGADTALVTPEAARRLHLALDPGRQTLLQGTGGDGGMAPNVVLRRMTIGDLTLDNRSVPLGALPALPRIVPPVAGLLGADLLAAFDVEIDLEQKRLALYAPASDHDGPCRPPWRGQFDTIELQRQGNRLLARVSLNGHDLLALIDTGARSIIVDTAAAAEMGVTADMLAVDPGGITSGVDMRDVRYHWHRFDSLRIGSETLRRPVLTVAPLQEHAAMLLGSDYFARRRVWLSYATNRMFVERPARRK